MTGGRINVSKPWPEAVLQRLLHWAEVDRAVAYGILANGWSLISGPVTLFLIATHFSTTVQGYYYTFGNVLALQVFVELGLANVIIQFASHEWSKLDLDGKRRIIGEPEALSRLVSLGRIAFLWYLVAGGIVAAGVGLGGYIFFSQSAYPGIDWVAPWFILCILSGINLWLVPAWSLLEGCNQVSNVYAFRMIRGILGGLSIWTAILLGAGLWTAPASAAVGIAWSGLFIAWRYRQFFRTFFSQMVGPCIKWRFEVWPMQWKIALSWLSGYFIFSLFTPVLFYYHGAAVAGQMGMTWVLLSALGGVSSLWVLTKAPRFGMFIAKKEYAELDRVFFRAVTVSTGVLLCGGIALWFVVYFLYVFNHPFSIRLLPPLPTGLFLLGQIAMITSGFFAVYLRAHKREPFLGLSIVNGVLMGLFTWLLGSRFAATGMAIGYLAVCVFFVLPNGIVIWYRCRTAWHSDAQ